MKPVDGACPSCGQRALQQFWSVDNVPVNSCLVVESAAAGRRYPRGDLRIAFCQACGFITNTAFDLERLRYDAAYEETQTFSPTFVAFQDALVSRLLSDHNLRERGVVEIGCGKGDFLARLAELGNVHGIGIDPSAVQARLQGVASERVCFINEYYGTQHADIIADLLICRHALEHIPDVTGFLRTLRAAIGNRGTPVFFELPETLRVLRETAYWDIYYEHCGYFTPGSLARAFELRNFTVTDVRLGYGDQYLMLEARPDADPHQRYSAQLDQPADIAHAVRGFERAIERTLDFWRGYFADAMRSGKRIAIWGSGSKCVAFLSTIGIDCEVADVTDVNPFRHGKYLVGTGKQIVPPAALATNVPDEVIVMNGIYRDEVAAMLNALGVQTRVRSVDDPIAASSAEAVDVAS